MLKQKQGIRNLWIHIPHKPTLSREWFGWELARDVADHLIQYGTIVKTGRGYRGKGLYYNTSTPLVDLQDYLIQNALTSKPILLPKHFYVSEFDEGVPIYNYKKFSNRKSFTDWFQQQSEESLNNLGKKTTENSTNYYYTLLKKDFEETVKWKANNTILVRHLNEDHYLSTNHFGYELANQVAEKLIKYGSFGDAHPGHCGTGLFYNKSTSFLRKLQPRPNNCFMIASVYDGEPWDEYKVFEKQEEFVEWLAKQSDWSMSGFSENPDSIPKEENIHLCLFRRINKNRLERFVSGEER